MNTIEPTLVTNEVELDFIRGFPNDSARCFAPGSSRAAINDATIPLYSEQDVAKAIRYALRRWSSFVLFLDDGRVAIDNNPAERALRPVSVGRKNYLFAGSDGGGENLADVMTIIETAKLNGVEPEAYLADLLGRIKDHMVNRLDELLPWNWSPLHHAGPKAA